MQKFIKLLLVFILVLLSTAKAQAYDVWINDLRTIFLSNKAIIYAVNLRTFNADDKNRNGIIEEELGETSGNFLNAINRLDEMQAMGINTLHLLPITPIGRVKALGTAGSLYAAASFNELNPQLKDKNSPLSIEEQAKKFIDECHKRRIRVIFDLPSCASYDLYLKRPELFKLDKTGNPVVPADWTDVRLLDAGRDSQINMDVYKMYQNFVDMAINLEADGIRADVATIKPYDFWKKLISETRVRNPQFLFLAEASPSWTKPPSEYAVFTPYDKLLNAGFDGYYGSYFNLKDWKTAGDLYSQVKFNLDLSKKYTDGKSVLGSFATHDEISPILLNGPMYAKMIIWLNATLPLNSYYVDGFPTGDDYLYFWANKKAKKTFTDDDYYFVHRGQIDIFNFSRRPGGNHIDILQDFITANRFKDYARNLVSQGAFTTYRTNSSSVFAYSRTYDKSMVIVIGNLDFKKTQNAQIFIPKISPESATIPIKMISIPQISKGKITVELIPGEVQVLYFEELSPSKNETAAQVQKY